MTGRIVRPALLLAGLAAGTASVVLGAGLRLLVLSIVAGGLLVAGEATARLEERRSWALGQHEDEESGGRPARIADSATFDLAVTVPIGLVAGGLSYLLVRLADTGSLAGWPLLALGGVGLVIAVGSLIYLGLPEELRRREPRGPWQRAHRPGRDTRPARSARRGRRAPSS